MRAALKFFLGQDEADEDSDDEEAANEPTLTAPTQAEIYRATKKVHPASLTLSYLITTPPQTC